MIVIIGESGCGKSSLVNAFVKRFPSYKRVVTYTTRPMRPGEVDGVDYHFVTEEQFKELDNNYKLAECNIYRGWHYGTPRIDDYGDKFIVVLTPAGLREFKRGVTESARRLITSVYLDVDRRSRLINLLKRGDDIEESYRRSLSDVGQFDGVEHEVDFVIKNPNFEHSIDEEVDMLFNHLRFN